MWNQKIFYFVSGLPSWSKITAILFFEISLSIFSLWLAYTLRLEEWHFPNKFQYSTYAIAAFGFVPVFWLFGVYKAVFRYLTSSQLIKLASSVFLFGLFFFLYLELLKFPTVPRSVAIIHPVIFVLLVICMRLVVCTFLLDGQSKLKKNVLIYGAGKAGIELASALKNNSIFRVDGFIDDDEKKHGRVLLDAKVLKLQDAARRIRQGLVSNIFLAAPSINVERRREIISFFADFEVQVSSLPSLSQIMLAKLPLVATEALKPEDFLPIRKKALIAQLPKIEGKTVFVTGAGGSIGSEICRQLIEARISRLVCIEHAEFNLYQVDAELRGLASTEEFCKTEIVSALVDVKNESDLRCLFEKYQPDVIYHAAAYKHVPLAEENVAQVFLNNSYATKLVADLSAEYKVEKFILVSTDKAVRPTNVMGATKRIAELITQALDSDNNDTVFTMVRFGNVIGSSGSAIPLFQSQITNGGPVTVTHPEITRYFMSISDAVSLVLAAGEMAQGGELFVLDMGEPHKVLDIVKRMISLNGLTLKTPDSKNGDIEIKFIGLRPGEKMFEELVLGNNLKPTQHEGILTANEVAMQHTELEKHMSRLLEICSSGEQGVVVDYLKSMSILVEAEHL